MDSRVVTRRHGWSLVVALALLGVSVCIALSSILEEFRP